MTPLLAWIRAHQLAAIAAISITVLALIAYCRPRPTPIPEREKTTIDSLAATKPAFDSSRIASAKAETVYVTRSAAQSRQAGHAAQQADSLRDVANALERVAEAGHDTLSRWRGVALMRQQEADSLRVAVGGLVTALADQTAARSLADNRATAAEARLASSENLNTRLAKDVAAGDRCRILLVASCPSRKAAIVGGAIIGAVAVALFDRRKP